MTRRHFGAILLAAIVGLMTFFVSAASVQAQNQKCCDYTVIVKVIDKCLPIKVVTEWTSGQDVIGVTQSGVYVQPVPGKCPPVPSFKAVTLDGITYVGLGQTVKYVDPNTGCCYVIDVQLDNNGCVVITISSC